MGEIETQRSKQKPLVVPRGHNYTTVARTHDKQQLVLPLE